jgi:hypothetical protein
VPEVTLYVARGVPGLGKTEWAREVVEHGRGRIVRVSSQILWAEGFGQAQRKRSFHRRSFQGRIIDSAVRAQALVFLSYGVSVVAHDPHLRVDDIDRWVTLAAGINPSVRVEIHDFGGNLKKICEGSHAVSSNVREMAERYHHLPKGYKNKFTTTNVKVKYH